ncbi:3080_t:CDS:2, partial [Gigaspora margarita]
LSSSDVLQNIKRLYENACTAENERVKANQAEILCWRNFIIGLDNSIDEIMIKEKMSTKKAKGLIYDFILAHNLSVSQIQIITDYFSKNPNTELPDDQEGSNIDSEEEISDEQYIPDFLAKLRLDLQNQGGPPTGREVAIGYLRGSKDIGEHLLLDELARKFYEIELYQIAKQKRNRISNLL